MVFRTTRGKDEVKNFDSAAELVREPLFQTDESTVEPAPFGFRGSQKFEESVNLQDPGLAAMTSETPNVSYIFVATKGGQVAMSRAMPISPKLR